MKTIGYVAAGGLGMATGLGVLHRVMSQAQAEDDGSGDPDYPLVATFAPAGMEIIGGALLGATALGVGFATSGRASTAAFGVSAFGFGVAAAPVAGFGYLVAAS